MKFPLEVVRYLAELDAALAARNVPDRDQIVTQIGEHIDVALAAHSEPTDPEIAAVLAELGDPLRIAEEAVPAEEPPNPPRRGRVGDEKSAPAASHAAASAMTCDVAPGKPSLMSRHWVPIVAATLWVFGAAIALSPLLLVPMSGSGSVRGLLLTVLTLPFDIPLIASVVVALCSPLFRMRDRVVWALSVPVAAMLAGAIGDGGLIGRVVGLSAVVVAVAAMVSITVRALREAGSWPPPTAHAEAGPAIG